MKRKGFFISGVGTGVGKTVAAGAIAHLLAKDGIAVGAMKPVQSGAKKIKGKLTSPDLDFIRSVSGAEDPDELAVPYLFKAPLSPYHAAQKEGKKVSLKKLVSAFSSISQNKEAVIVEGAGGLMVPLTEKIFWPDFIRAINLPLILATHSELGMIHQTLSAVHSAEMHGLEIAGLVIVETSRKKHPEVDMKWLEKISHYPVLGVIPFSNSAKADSPNVKGFRLHIEKNLSAKPFKDFLNRKGIRNMQKRLEAADKKNIWRPFTQMKEWEKENVVIIESGRGTIITDLEGRDFYDGHSSYWVNVHGHGNPRLSRTFARQAARLEHSTFLGLSNRPAIELAEKLAEIAPKGLNKVFYSDNGSTAVEVALKMSVQYFRQREDRKPKKTIFVALGEAYHGDTLGAVAVGGVEVWRNVFGPLLTDVIFAPSPYCYRCPLGKKLPECKLACADEMEALLERHKDEIAGFIIEPMVQCPGGIITAPKGYLERVRKACKKNDVLMIADEVAVGFGRTGEMFACNHENVSPDLICLSKSLGAGVVPIAATLATSEIFAAFLGDYSERKTFFHGHTFTAYPPACAVALESLKMYREKGLIKSIKSKSGDLSELLEKFKTLPHVGDVRQLGMAVGIELVKDKESGAPFPAELRAGQIAISEARKRGLIVRPLGDIVVFFPILDASGKDIRKMTDILYESIAKAPVI